jgi:hypothetical protein
MNLLRHMIVICLCSCLCLVGCGADSEGSVPSMAETTQHTEDNALEPTEAKQEMIGRSAWSFFHWRIYVAV